MRENGYRFSSADVYPQVKKAVRYMLENSADSDAAPDFVLYSTNAKLATAADVLQSKVTCSTSFEAAFKQIQNYIGQQSIDEKIRVVFMTDGHDTASCNLPMATRLFHAFLQSCKRNVVVHTLGFSSGHNRTFLEEIRTMGSSDGIYRYVDDGADADAGGLEGCFGEIFDFLEQTSLRSFTVDAGAAAAAAATAGATTTFTATPTRKADGALAFDVMLAGAEAACFAGVEGSLSGPPVTVVMDSGERVVLEAAPADALFEIRTIEESSITSAEDLATMQRALTNIQIAKAPKPQRKALTEARLVAQEKLDAFHQLFADVGRGLVAGEGLASRLQSLRYEATFAKARRGREMNKRAAKNADAAMTVEARLRALPPIPHGAMAPQRIGQELVCSLSGDTMAEVVADSHDDVMCFALRVTRPEHVIDAPTQVALKGICVGGYSHETFVSTAGFTIGRAGAEAAHGGFVASSGDGDQADSMGLFLAADGQRMNACLPLYLCEEHWARVEVMLEPLLGYFFTLDPLGFKGDQYIALFGVLGQALALRQSGHWPESEWSEFILADMAQLCRAVMPKARAYLRGGRYTQQTGLGKEGDGDILEDFIASPDGRTKEKVPSLSVIVGWAHATNATAAAPGATVTLPPLAFQTAFAEELWRRTLGWMYKGSPDAVGELLERLVYGPPATETRSMRMLPGAGPAGDTIDPAKDQEFGEFADYKLGRLGKKKAAVLRKKYGGAAPVAERLLSEEAGKASRVPREIASYAEHSEYMDAIVAGQIAKLAKHCGPVGAMWAGSPLGEGFDGPTRHLMMVQALMYCSSSSYTSALGAGTVANTFDVARSYPSGSAEAIATVAASFHERLEQRRAERWDAIVRAKNEALTAQQIAMCTSDLATVGRLLAACPTRGGAVFDRFVALLCDGEVDGVPIPSVRRKIRAVLTGKMRIGSEDEPVDVISNGECWASCPVGIVERLAAVVGEEAFCKIEVSMRGTVGWTYRSSDIPNRHGYHNSHPNPALVCSFTGFSGRAKGGKQLGL